MLKAKGAGVGEEVFKDGAREGERVGERVDIFGVCLKLIERLKGGGVDGGRGAEDVILNNIRLEHAQRSGKTRGYRDFHK